MNLLQWTGVPAVACALLMAAAGSTAWGEEPVVATDAGELRGYVDSRKNIYIFKGVHYGENTAGGNRFRAPVPVAPWKGRVDALAFGDACPQTGTAGRNARMANGEVVQLPMSEDCLVLNIWTPGLDGKRPVMVWLHGQGFSGGAGSEPMYDGANLAKRGDVVVVTINHRLNVFGYLYLAEIAGPEYAQSGVAGMLDAELALKWIRANIDRFGGDAANVTLFGESGGGAKVSTMLAMPSSRTLFQRGIIQSGPGLRAVTPDAATRAARALMEKLGVETVVALEQVPAEEILAAIGPQGPGESLRIAPVVDGLNLPQHPFEPEAAPSSVGKPIMIGSNRDEALLFNLRHPRRNTMTMVELTEALQSRMEEGWRKVLDTYRFSRPHATPWELFIAITGERVRRGSITLAERASKAGNPVFMYLFEFEVNDELKAAHGMEIVYAFSNASAINPRPETVAVENDMANAWISFARDGDPNHPGLALWPLYDTRKRATMVFDVPSRIVNDPRREERLIWEDIELPVRF